MDTIAVAPTLEISLEYTVCGCVDRWLVYQLAEDAVRQVDVPCVPEFCQTCAQDGPCATRRAMPPAYQPVAFSDVAVGGPKRYRRLRASA